LPGPLCLGGIMFAYVGGKKRPKKTLEAAVRALSEGYSGETLIYDTETGEIFSLSGEPAVVLTPSQYQLIKTLLGICSLCATTDFTFPKQTVTDIIPKLGAQLAKDAVLTARDIYIKLWRKHGNRQPGGAQSPG
jgi:hypothetical protein